MLCTSQPACFFPLSRLFFCSFLSQYIFQARPQMSHGLRTQHVVQRPGISAWLVCYGTHYCGLFWPLFSAFLFLWQLNFDPTSFTHRDVVKFRFSEKATKVWKEINFFDIHTNGRFFKIIVTISEYLNFKCLPFHFTTLVPTDH